MLLNVAVEKGLVGLVEAEEVGRLLSLELELERLRPNVLVPATGAFEVVGSGLGGGGLNVAERG